MPSLLGELTPFFWLMDLDLISLKCPVYGFSMPLGSPSGFGRVRQVHFCSRFKVALSAYLQCCRRLLVRGVIVGASVPLSRPALLAEAGWEGACVDLFLCPLHRRHLCGLPSAPLSLPSVLWGLCALCVVGHVCPCCISLACPLLHRAMSSSFCSPARPLGHVGCVHCPSLCASPLRAPGPPFGLQGLCVLQGFGCRHTRLPGPALCATRVVCTREVCVLLGSRFPEPAIWLGPQFMSC